MNHETSQRGQNLTNQELEGPRGP